MTDKISVAEFYKRVVSFRQKMGIKLEPEQYRNIFKMLGISYLNVDQNDSDFSLTVAQHFQDTVAEYIRRMSLMGHAI